MRVIRDLSDRVKQLEASQQPRQAPAQASPTAAAAAQAQASPAPSAVAQARPAEPAVEARLAQVESSVSQLSRASLREATGLPLHGFADVSAFARTGNRPRGFGAGNLDFYLTPELGGGFKSLVELVFERSDEGETAVDLERVQVGYTFSDAATLWMGRVHTPYGYWNTAFHHGQQIQTSILRPRFLDFEDKGGVLPSHTVGLWLAGQLPAGAGRITYDVVGANAPRLKDGVLDMNNSEATGHSAAWVGNLGYRFGGAAEGLKLGAHAMGFRIADDGTNPLLGYSSLTRVRAAGLYAVYEADPWEFMAEWYQFRNKDLLSGAGPYRSNLAFAQAGYTWGRLTPYARYESAKIDQEDDYFAGQYSGQSYRKSVLGVRVAATPRTAVKVEASRIRFTDRETDSYGEIRSELSVGF